MNIPHEYGSKQRLLRVMVDVLTHPHGNTKRQLAQRYGVNPATIVRDIEELRNAGFVVEQDERFRYGFETNRAYEQLKDLLHFSEEDQVMLHAAIDTIDRHGKRGARLKRKLKSLYDYRQLGHAYLRAAYLTKVDALKQAIENRTAVHLKDYRSSNSDTVRSRHIEPFHLEPSEDLLHAYDLEESGIRHFKLTRFARVIPSNQAWTNESKHHVEKSDVFRVVNDKTVPVYLRLKVGGYNALIERFPLAAAYTQPSGGTPDVYTFEASVNANFLGLTNFIMGHYHQVIEVVEPEALITHLRDAAKQFEENLGGAQ